MSESSGRIVEKVQRALECPICFDDYGDKEIYQCTNGHALCADCLRRCTKRCPVCQATFPRRRIRNRALEFVSSAVAEGQTTDTEDEAESPPPKRRRARGHVHVGVTCDSVVCKNANNGVIQGERFKCIECPNFNLCRVCVGRAHKKHLFVRIPNPVLAERVDGIFPVLINEPEPAAAAGDPVQAGATSFFKRIWNGLATAFRFGRGNN